MKKITTAASMAIAFALLVGCQSATTTPTQTSPGVKNFKYGLGDGQTMSTAVEIRTRSETDGGVMIREWIKQRYPGYTIQQQELIEQRDKAYNMITIIGPSNTAHSIFFDISTYYRRIGNDQFPKPFS
jgi:outer membrane biogenesis lipoprotein LolB